MGIESAVMRRTLDDGAATRRGQCVPGPADVVADRCQRLVDLASPVGPVAGGGGLDRLRADSAYVGEAGGYVIAPVLGKGAAAALAIVGVVVRGAATA